MKIGEAQKAYREQLSFLRGQRSDYVKQQEENRKKMEEAGKNNTSPGVTLELSKQYMERDKELQEKIEELSGQIKKDEKGLDALIEQEVGIFNSVASEQQADAMKKYFQDMIKCMEIARRISKGDKVPAQDEKRLMDYDMDLYQMAHNMAAFNMDEKHKEWDSLWADEEENEYEDPEEVAANAEAAVGAPEGVVVEGASQETGSEE